MKFALNMNLNLSVFIPMSPYAPVRRKYSMFPTELKKIGYYILTEHRMLYINSYLEVQCSVVEMF